MHYSTECQSRKWLDCGLTASVILEEGEWSGADGCRRYEQHAPVCSVPVAFDPMTFLKLRAASSCNSRVSGVRCCMEPCRLRHA